MTGRSLPLLLLLCAPALASDSPDLPRCWTGLCLGDTIEQVRRIYPPKRDWSSYREPGGEVVRIHVERAYAKAFPPGTETMRLGMSGGRLVHFQLIYDKDASRRMPLDKLVVELSMSYGEPRRVGLRYFWEDGDTVLVARNAEVPSPDGKGSMLRASVELMDAGVSR